MKKLLCAFYAILLLSACQKEISIENPDLNSGGGGNNNGTRLTRSGTRIGSDSLTIDFLYSGNNRLSTLVYSGTADGIPVDIQQKLNRNASGAITSLVMKSPLFLAIGLDQDSLIKKFTYNAAGRYHWAVSHYKFSGQSQSDSAYFSYDASGKIASVVNFFDDGTGYVESSKEEYTYNGNNLQTVKTFEDLGSGNLELQQTTTFEYDTKVNPMQHTADAPVLGMIDFYSANNVVKRTVVITDPAGTYVSNIAFTYNSNNRPTKGVITTGNATSSTTYYYQ